MSAEAIAALTLTHWLPDLKGDWIGVDKGSLILARHQIPMKIAIGDFDSVTDEEFRFLKKYAREVIRLNPIKDDSDSEAAVQLLIQRGYKKITFLDSLGGRADQAYVNLMLANKHPRLLWLLDPQNKIYALDAGSYQITKEEYTYISFFTFDKAVITLEGMKYPLQRRTITINDLYTLSNEIVGDAGRIIIHTGTVLVMQTKDKKKIPSE